MPACGGPSYDGGTLGSSSLAEVLFWKEIVL
jgi:hypothetical protein